MPKLLNYKFPEGRNFLNWDNTGLKRSSKINFSVFERHLWAVVGKLTGCIFYLCSFFKGEPKPPSKLFLASAHCQWIGTDSPYYRQARQRLPISGIYFHASSVESYDCFEYKKIKINHLTGLPVCSAVIHFIRWMVRSSDEKNFIGFGSLLVSDIAINDI